MEYSIDVLNEELLEDGEIEDEEPPALKSAPVVIQQQKPKPVQEAALVGQNKSSEPLRSQRSFENNDKPHKEQRVPFFKGKRKIVDNEDDERWKKDGKRNRRNCEFERDSESGRMRLDGELGEDEEEMMFVRGASPYLHEEGRGRWDRDADEDERSEMPHRPVRTFRGRGSLSRRGERQRGRGRGVGRGGMRGSKRKREDGEMCVFFLQGKCHKGPDCPFVHEILPPRKPELCKFYMKDRCAKKDQCLYMHSDFPCKYYHTGLKCYANKKCKFSHAPLTDSTRNILAKHLDTAPKDILGDFPRRDRDQRDRGDPRDMRGDPRDMRGDSRDMRGESRDMRGGPRDMRGDSRDMRGDSRDMRGDSREMRGEPREMRGDSRDLRSDSREMRGDSRDMRGDSREMMRELRGEFMRNKHDRDRKIPSLFDIKVSIPDDMRNSDGSHTPMPSPTQRSQDSTRSSDRDNCAADHLRERERDKEQEKEREHERLRLEKAERSKERKAKREKAREHRKERREKREKLKEMKRERNRDTIIERNELEENESNHNPDIMSPTQSEENIRNSVEDSRPTNPDKSLEELDKKATLSSEMNGLFPQHLPKKQQELFLRIQQQQREAENSQASANDEDEEDKAEEDNWYSSDEETSPAISAPLSQPGNTSTVTPLLNILAAPASTPFIPANLDLSNLSTVFEALTNLQKMSSATKVAEQQISTPTTAVSTKSVAEQADSPKAEPPRMRDPRLRSDGCVEDLRRSTEGPIDVDLRPQSSVRSKSQAPPEPSGGDVDLRSLPFKPVQHSAANEIDASLSSHSPIIWQLVPVDAVRADYAILQIQPKPGVLDPRLRRVARPPTDELGLPRDPRQRLLDEPRPRPPLLATPSVPPTPRYDEDHRSQFYRMDSDMRQFPPPTPRLEDDTYAPGPSRPMDPRQRTRTIEDPRRTPAYSPRPDDIDLRPQMTPRVPFVNFNN